MPKRVARVAIAVLVLASLASAEQPVAPSSAPPRIPVREETLANGLKLLLVERHESPTIACGWVAKVGSVNEPTGLTGISHLFEHMMFKGTRTIGTTDYAKDAEILRRQDAVRAEMEQEYALLRGKLRRGEITGNIYEPGNMTPRLKELRAELEKLFAAEKEVLVSEELDTIYTAQGASGLNAGTTEDQTFYFVTVPANRLELWCWMESDRLAQPVFREFYSERDVVREERRLRVESTPTGKFEETFDAMFWQSSPYKHPVIGWPSDVESITRAQAEAYFQTYYAPNNLTAVLVGDFAADEALALARRYFGRIPRGAVPPPEVITTEVAQVAEKRFLAEAETNPEIDIRFHAAPFGHRDAPASQLIADLLNRRTGRLYRSLVEGAQVAIGEPFAYYRELRYEGMFEVGAEVKDGRTPAEAEAALLAELDKLGKEPVGERELQKVKNQALANTFRRMQSNTSLLFQLMVADSLGDWHAVNETPAKVQAVTAADLQRVAGALFAKEGRNVAVYTRKDGGAGEDPEVAALPAPLKAMVRQQLAEWQGVKDPVAIEKDLQQLEQMGGRVSPQAKPAFGYLKRKAVERIEQLRASGGADEAADPEGGP